MNENNEMLLEKSSLTKNFIEEYITPVIVRKKSIKDANAAWNQAIEEDFKTNGTLEDLKSFLTARFKKGIACLWTTFRDEFIQKDSNNFLRILTSQQQKYIKDAWDTHKDFL